jgi:hypothetical protein
MVTAVLVLALAAVPAQAIEPPDGCNHPLDYTPPNNVTFRASPVAGKPWTLNANIDPQYVQPGSLTMTFKPDSGSPATITPPANADFNFTPAVAGNITVTAHWQAQNCADPVSYTDALDGLSLVV